MSAFTPAPTLVDGSLTPFPIMCLTIGAATLLPDADVVLLVDVHVRAKSDLEVIEHDLMMYYTADIGGGLDVAANQ